MYAALNCGFMLTYCTYFFIDVSLTYSIGQIPPTFLRVVLLTYFKCTTLQSLLSPLLLTSLITFPSYLTSKNLLSSFNHTKSPISHSIEPVVINKKLECCIYNFLIYFVKLIDLEYSWL